APGYAINSASVSLQAGQQFARGGIQKSNRPVTRTRGQGLSVRTPSNAVDILSVSLQASQHCASGGIPELYCLVSTARDQGLSIRTPRNAADIPSVSLHADQHFARGGIPEFQRRVTSTRGQGLSIRSGGSKNRCVQYLNPVVVIGQLNEARDQIVPYLGATRYSIGQEQIQTQSQGSNA